MFERRSSNEGTQAMSARQFTKEAQDPDDEVARECAVLYASATVHYVRRIIRHISELDPSDSPFEKVEDFDPAHAGKPPIEADVLAQDFLESVVKANPPRTPLGEPIFLGEEVPAAYRALNRDQKYITVRSDPIDGTSNMVHCGDGFSTVVTIEQWRPAMARWQHLAGAIVRHDGDGLSWSNRGVHRHNVVIDFAELPPTVLPRILERPAIPPFRNFRLSDEWREKVAYSGATVAAHSSIRRTELLDHFSSLVSRPEFLDFRSGSASAWGLCNRRLGFVFELRPTTIHDSAHLYPFSYLGGNVVDHDYRPINVAEIFDKNADPTSNQKVVPPYIAYVDERSVQFLQTVLDGSGPS
jgi:hypothetical protein